MIFRPFAYRLLSSTCSNPCVGEENEKTRISHIDQTLFFDANNSLTINEMVDEMLLHICSFENNRLSVDRIHDSMADLALLLRNPADFSDDE